MDVREKITEFGESFMIPTWIERIDNSHGWQLRLGKTQFFADGTNDGSGSAASLKRAILELKRRIKTTPVPNYLKSKTRPDKFNDLPLGISGPTPSKIRGRDLLQHHLQISIPRFDKTPTTRKVYIGTDNTYSDERFEKALVKAKSIRDQAVEVYERENAAAARKAVAGL